MEVDCVAHGVRLGRLLEIEMRDLPERMDAGIGASGALYRDPFAGEGEYCLLDRLLHGRAVRLALPADEGAAVVFDDDLPTRHGRTVPAGRSRPRRNAAASIAQIRTAAGGEKRGQAG